jgi:hypothetical protein
MKGSIKFPVQDEFTMSLKAQTGIVAVKDFKFNYNTKVDYFIPEGNIIVLLVENGSMNNIKGNTVIYTCKENLLSIKMFEIIINYYEQFKQKAF